MLAMRLRIPELIREYRPDVRLTGYAIAQASGGKINSTLAQRLLTGPAQVHMSTLDLLADFFGCDPSELLARDDAPAPKAKPPAAPAVGKRGKRKHAA